MFSIIFAIVCLMVACMVIGAMIVLNWMLSSKHIKETIDYALERYYKMRNEK